MLNFLAENTWAFAACAGALGLFVGSFLNVVVFRTPQMLERQWVGDSLDMLSAAVEDDAARARLREDLLEVRRKAAPGAAEPTEDAYNLSVPRSRCPHCGHQIKAIENVPVLSWLALRGKCSACKAPISARYPIVELLTGLASAAVALRFGYAPEAAGALLLTWALIALAGIDFDTKLLPDGITLPFLWLGLAFNLFATFVPLGEAVVGAIAGYGVLWLVYHAFRLVTGKEGMGYGDFKLLAMLGAWLGAKMLPIIILLSSLVGACVGIGLIALVGRDRSVPIPFGPFLAAAGFLALMAGPSIMRAYLGGA